MRRWCFFLAFLFLLAPAAQAESLPMARDLDKDARLSERQGRPILIFFYADSCPYCHEVRDLYIEPMQSDENYRERLIIRVVDVDGAQDLRDFGGARVAHADFAYQRGVSFTPVIRLYGPDGKELVPEVLGYTTPDFYGSYLEKAIDTAIEKLHSKQRTDARHLSR
jgi:thiol-disulfide isomerase/thioredoxin